MSALRRAAPWLVAGGILLALALRVDLAATLSAARGADLGRWSLLALSFSALWLALDAIGLRGLFARAGAPLSLGAMAGARAASYPWMALSFDLANAALIARLRRATGAPLTVLAGAMLVHYACDFLALSSTAFGASLALDGRVAAVLRPVVLALALGTLAALAAARRGLSRLGRGALADSLRGYRARDLLRLVALRALFYASFAAFVWSTLPCLGLSVPFADVLARMPLVQSVAALPIAPGGLGTAQAAMLALFSGFGPPERWLAYALLYSATLVAVRTPLGFAVWPVAVGGRGPALEESA
jgi:uncharacterized membrane protein YbhN (UPF0104 family)